MYFLLSYILCISSPIQELEPGATPVRAGRCADRYPHGPQSTV